jgi:hypothetical protein
VHERKISMGVYINGMEMPKEGFITITITSDGRVVGNSKKENGKFEYLDNEDIAKAVPVPKHGRLIEADALLRGCKRIEGKYATREFAFSQSAIENAPTILEAEEG